MSREMLGNEKRTGRLIFASGGQLPNSRSPPRDRYKTQLSRSGYLGKLS